MRNLHALGFVFLLLLLGAGFAWAKSPAIVGMVTEIQGQAYWQSDVKKKPISELAELTENSKLVLSKNSKLAVMYLQTGQQYELSGPSLVQFKNDQPIALNGVSPKKIGVTASAESKARIEPKKVQTAGQTLVSTEQKQDPNLPVAAASAPPPPPPMAAPSPVSAAPVASTEDIAAARVRMAEYEAAKRTAEAEVMAARQAEMASRQVEREAAEAASTAASSSEPLAADVAAPAEPPKPVCAPPESDSGSGQSELPPCSEIKD
ncbi:MAG: hypothetical protein ACREO1_07385 [Arenimonas sp.]